MSYEEDVGRLEQEFALRFFRAQITIRSRTIKGTKRIYVTTVGAYKVESGRLIELFFPSVYLYSSDYSTLTYKYKGEI